jgi:hypothetical protein
MVSEIKRLVDTENYIKLLERQSFKELVEIATSEILLKHKYSNQEALKLIIAAAELVCCDNSFLNFGDIGIYRDSDGHIVQCNAEYIQRSKTGERKTFFLGLKIGHSKIEWSNYSEICRDKIDKAMKTCSNSQIAVLKKLIYNTVIKKVAKSLKYADNDEQPDR